MGPIWGRQDPGGPHDGPMKFAIWVVFFALDVFDTSSHYTQQAILIDSRHSQHKHIMLEHYSGVYSDKNGLLLPCIVSQNQFVVTQNKKSKLKKSS